MRILRYWKTIKVMHGVDVTIVPQQEIVEGRDSFFDDIVAFVQMDDTFEYVLFDRNEVLIRDRKKI